MRLTMFVGFCCGLVFAVLFVSSFGQATASPISERIAPPMPVERIVQQSVEPEAPIRQREATPAPSGRWIRALVTVYTPWDAIDANSGYQDGFTSTMVNTQSSNPNHIYGIAADPRAIPYGTKVYVPGYWEALQRNHHSRPTRMTVVDDTGGAMRQSYRRGITHIDLRFRTTSGALNWIRNNSHLGTVDRQGRLWMDVFIYDR